MSVFLDLILFSRTLLINTSDKISQIFRRAQHTVQCQTI